MPTSARRLVIVRAGDRSLHPAWTRSAETRSWDLVVSYFGTDLTRFRNERRIDDPGLKYPGLRTLLMRENFWRDYDYIWLPDDDLMIEQEGIDALFDEMAALDLELAQPALSQASFFSHAITLRHSSFRVRYTDFVEIMAPCFRRAFLETCLPAFAESTSGWGLDWVFPSLRSDTTHGCAILDSIEITHTRPVGGPSYALLRKQGITARHESAAVRSRHGIAPEAKPTVLAAITGDGRRLDRGHSDDDAALDALLARDSRAILSARTRLTFQPLRYQWPSRFAQGRWGQ